MNALALVLAARLLGVRARLGRTLLCAAFGALAAAMARDLPRRQAALLFLPLAVVMMALMRGRRAFVRPLRAAAALLASYGLLGGVLLALVGATGSLPIGYALGGVCTLAIAHQALKIRRVRPRAARLHVRHRGRTAAFEAIIDSGNTLRDYLTGLPVIVLAEETGRRALGLGAAPLRPLFADTAGGRQMMGALQAETIMISMEGKHVCVRAVLALSPGLDRGAPALIPAALLEEETKGD